MIIELNLQRLSSASYKPPTHVKLLRSVGSVSAVMIKISLATGMNVALAGNDHPDYARDNSQDNTHDSAGNVSELPVVTFTERKRVNTNSAAQICKQQNEGEDVITQTQDYLQTMGCQAAFWIDGIGGRSASATEARRTSGYLRLSAEYTEYDGFDIKLKGQLDSELPYLGKRLSAFIGRAPERAETRSRSSNFYTDNLFSQATDDDEWLVGLGYRVPRFEKFDTSAKAGVTSFSLPKLFIQATGRVVFHDTPTSLSDAMIRPFWTNRDGVGLTIQTSVSKALAAHDYIMRLAQVSSVTEKTKGLRWTANFTVFQRTSDTTGLAWQLRAAGETEAAESLGIYGASLNYRHPFGDLISEWRVSYDFPRAGPDEARSGSAGLSVELTLPFGL